MKKIFVLIALLIFSTSAFAKDVTLQWDASPTDGVTGYKVYMSSTNTMNNPTSVDVGLVLTQVIANLPNEDGLYFAVTAYNAVQQESVYSNVVYSPGFSAPQAPGNARGTTTDNGVQVPL